MQMQPIKSSQIAAVGHDPATNTLRVQFSPRKDGTPGPVYDYQNITDAHHRELMNAESVGSHFIKNIKPHPDRFPYKRIA